MSRMRNTCSAIGHNSALMYLDKYEIPAGSELGEIDVQRPDLMADSKDSETGEIGINNDTYVLSSYGMIRKGKRKLDSQFSTHD